MVGANSSRTRGELTRWVLVSAGSFLANLGITIVCTEWLGFPAFVSFAVALVVVQAGNFLAIRYVIFPGDNLPIRQQAYRYVGLALGFRATEWIVFSALHLTSGIDYRGLVVAVLAGSSLVKFVAYRRWLLRPR